MPKRPAPLAADSSSNSLIHEDKRARESFTDNLCFEGLKIQILSPKIDPDQLEQLFDFAESHGAIICNEPSDADVIVTGISMRKRLERHVEWSLAQTKAIVTPAWIEDSIKADQCLLWGKYAAIQGLAQDSDMSFPQSKPTSTSSAFTSNASTSKVLLSSSDFSPRYESFFACERHSPLICINQALVDELWIIRKAREVDGEKRSMLSYARAISAIKAYPSKIRRLDDVKSLSHIGPKTLGMIGEFLEYGHIKHAREITNSTKYQTLLRFTLIYGIGPTTAIKLYDLNLRTYEHLAIYANVDSHETDQLGVGPAMPEGESHGAKRLTWSEGIRLRDDLAVKIPRAEVEEIGRRVGIELETIMPGCEYTICGGYRRGKPESNDVDIVFTHPIGKGKEAEAADLCTKLVLRLQVAGLITHIMHLPSFRSRTGLPHRPKNRDGWDTLEKAMTVLRFPGDDESSPPGVHRRVDLIYAPRDVYWTAVVGWTGSTMFERDIRLWAKRKKQMKFDSSGITRLRDTKQLFAKSEQDVFDILGLKWIDPTLRNAD